MNNEAQQPLDYATDPDPSRIHTRPLKTRYERVAKITKNVMFVVGFMLICFGLTWQSLSIIGGGK